MRIPIKKEAQYDREEPHAIKIFRGNIWLPFLGSHSRLDYLKSKGGIVMALSGEMETRLNLKGKGRNAFRNLRAVEENVSEIICLLRELGLGIGNIINPEKGHLSIVKSEDSKNQTSNP
ncbi:MAG: hypothetical protein Q7J31_04725, partial [Syntrophales bacterium]|nr:hypothetical protein [Syntrophales bacterium]